jgi:hypothetical protein
MAMGESMSSDIALRGWQDRKGAMRTVIGLFEDTIDAQRALGALRKAEYQPDQISFIVRDARGEKDLDDDSPGAVARAVIASALETVGTWLQGLAELIVPDRGAFLVSGPLGAAVTAAQVHELPADATADDVQMLREAFTRFGFAHEEAGYLERRLVAGNMLIAVTFEDGHEQGEIQTVLSEYEAVHVVAAESEHWVSGPIPALLRASTTSSEIVADIAVPFLRLCTKSERHDACGSEVIDRNGEACGRVEELLANQMALDSGEDAPQVRYAVIGFGGILGLGRHLVALPIELINLNEQPARMNIDRDALQHAPEFDEDTPFSRSEERQLYTYFEISPYWSE